MVLETIDTYIARHHNTIGQYIFTSLILDIYIMEEWCPGAQVLKQWWEQEQKRLGSRTRGGTGKGGGEDRYIREKIIWGGGQEQRLRQRVTITPNTNSNIS